MRTKTEIDLDKITQGLVWFFCLTKIKGLDFIKETFKLKAGVMTVLKKIIESELPFEEFSGGLSPAECLVLFILRKEGNLEPKVLAGLTFLEEEEVDKVCESLAAKGFIRFK